MKARPIIMSGESVRAIIAGRKSQTRRVLNPQPPEHMESPHRLSCGQWVITDNRPPDVLDDYPIRCPHGAPGDLLWVKETWAEVHPCQADGRQSSDSRAGIPGPPTAAYRVVWRADGEVPPVYYAPDYPFRTLVDNGSPCKTRWRSPLYMPRRASRLTLRVTDVRVERVQDISDEDAIAEGVTCVPYRRLWDSINGSKPGRAWADNPLVWAISFERAT